MEVGHIVKTIRERIYWSPPQHSTSELKPIDFAYFDHLKQQIKELDVYIDNGGPVLVVGPPSSGKSMLLEYCLKRYREHSDLLVSRVNALLTQNPISLLNSIIKDLHASSSTPNSDIHEDHEVGDELDEEMGFADLANLNSLKNNNSIKILKNLFIDVLDKTQKKIIILLDNFELCSANKQVLIYGLTDSMPKSNRVSFVAISSYLKTYSLMEKRIVSRFPNRQVLIPAINNASILIKFFENLMTIHENNDPYAREWNERIQIIMKSDQFIQLISSILWTSKLKLFMSILDIALLRLNPIHRFIEVEDLQYANSVLNYDRMKEVILNMSLLELIVLVEVSRLTKIFYLSSNDSTVINFDRIYEEYQAYVYNENNNSTQFKYSRHHLWRAFENLLEHGILFLKKSFHVPREHQEVSLAFGYDQLKTYLMEGYKEDKTPYFLLERLDQEEISSKNY